jgi:hypothetical protein
MKSYSYDWGGCCVCLLERFDLETNQVFLENTVIKEHEYIPLQ